MALCSDNREALFSGHHTIIHLTAWPAWAKWRGVDSVSSTSGCILTQASENIKCDMKDAGILLQRALEFS